MPVASTASRTATICHALSDETRVAIVEMLVEGERCVCELQDALDAAQSRLSFHLRVLKDAGLVADRKEGRWSYYSLDAEAFAELSSLVSSLKPSRRTLPTFRAKNACCD